MNTYLKSIAHEYVETIDMIASGMYSGDELRDLEAQRGVLHDQLVRLIRKDIPRSKMANYVRNNIL